MQNPKRNRHCRNLTWLSGGLSPTVQLSTAARVKSMDCNQMKYLEHEHNGFKCMFSHVGVVEDLKTISLNYLRIPSKAHIIPCS